MPVKRAAFAPMPIARVKIATKAKPGLRRSVRQPYRKSCQRVSMVFAPMCFRSEGVFYFSINVCLRPVRVLLQDHAGLTRRASVAFRILQPGLELVAHLTQDECGQDI